jgi:carboxymethylenebutenolidase
MHARFTARSACSASVARMCHDHDSRPPFLPAHRVLPRLAGGAGAEHLETPSADGSTVTVALAETPSPKGPAVVILPDVRGLAPFYDALAERFAAAGHHAAVLDYFGRTHGFPHGDDFDRMEATKQTKQGQIQDDLAATTALLKERTGAEQVVVVGFCFGGTNTYLTAANPDLDFDGYVAFYGGQNGARWGFDNPADVAAQMSGPILGLFGGGDKGISAEDVQRLEDALTAADVDHDIHTYPGAPHGFFDHGLEEWAEACADAWERVLTFLEGVGAKTAA